MGDLNLNLRDMQREPHPDPCRDCGRTHLRGERISVRVPTGEANADRIVWEGCVDCWVRRTSPPHTADCPARHLPSWCPECATWSGRAPLEDRP